MGESFLTTATATLALSLFSIGAIGIREVKRGRAAIQNKAALADRGYSEAQIERVLKAETEQDIRQAIQEEDQKRDPEMVAKAAAEILQRSEDAGRLERAGGLGLPTVQRMDDGKFLVLGTGGEIVAEDVDGIVASQHVDNALHRQLMQFANVQRALIDGLVAAAGKDGIEVEFSVEEQKALDAMANLTPEALAIRVAAWEAENKTSAEGLSFVAMGLNNVQRVKEGLYRSINKVAKATRPEAVIAALEEHAEGIFKVALDRGDFTRDEAAQWIKDYTTETKDALLPEGFDALGDDAKFHALTEAMSAMSVAYFTGNVNKSRLNPRLRAFFERIAELMRAVVARSIKIKQAQEAGAIGADFESFLARSVGLDFDQTVEARAHSAAEDFAGVMSAQTASIAPLGANGGKEGAVGAEDQRKAALAAEQAFEQAVDSISKGTYDMTRPVPVGNTPAVLLAAGADPLPITMPPSMVKKVTAEAHDLSVSLVKQVGRAIKDPVFVFESATVPDALTVILDIKHNGQNVLIAVHLNKREGNHEVNRITSIYDKSNPRAVEGWIKAGLLRYIHQQKGRDWFRSRGLQLPKEGTNRGNKKLRTNADVVNPTLSIAPVQFADLESALLAMDKDPVLRRERVAMTLRRVKEIRQQFDEMRAESQAQAQDRGWQVSRLEEQKASAIADLNAEEKKEALAAKKRSAERYASRAEGLADEDPKIKRLERESAREGRRIEGEAAIKYSVAR